MRMHSDPSMELVVLGWRYIWNSYVCWKVQLQQLKKYVKGKSPYFNTKYLGVVIGMINDFNWILSKKPIILVPEDMSAAETCLFGAGCNLRTTSGNCLVEQSTGY